jgi:Transposase, Mutator family
VLEAVRTYVQGLSSYRVVASLLERRIGRSVGRVTINHWVHELASQAKSPLQVSMELQPQWGGFIGVDGKVIHIAGERAFLFIGVDHPTQDIVHALVAPDEDGDVYAQLLTEARLDAGYPLLGVVADLGNGFVNAHRDHFGMLPLQACRVHFDRRLRRDIPVLIKSPKAALGAELRNRIRAVLHAPNFLDACRSLEALLIDRERFAGLHQHRNPLGSLEKNFALYMAHHFTPGLPPDNNATENVIKQLNKKLRLMEGFHSLESAERYVRLLVGCYRFKRFTDSVRNNGKSPLEHAGIDLEGCDWLSFLLPS